MAENSAVRTPGTVEVTCLCALIAAMLDATIVTYSRDIHALVCALRWRTGGGRDPDLDHLPAPYTCRVVSFSSQCRCPEAGRAHPVGSGSAFRFASEAHA